MASEHIIWTNGREVNVHVEHRAKSRSYSFRASSLYEDYCPPLISHRLDLVVRCGEDQVCGECETPWCENTLRVARLVVNEFPLHMVEDYGDSVFWLFDMCEEGPSAILGQMLDVLDQEGVIDLSPSEGAILHLQNLEVRSDLRRQGIGTRLIRYAAALLGRSAADLLVCEVEPVACPYGPLFADPKRPGDVIWSRAEEINDFLRSLSFSRWQVSGHDVRWELPDLGNPEAVCYFKVVDAATRIQMLAG